MRDGPYDIEIFTDYFNFAENETDFEIKCLLWFNKIG